MTTASALLVAASSLISVAFASYHSGKRRGRVTLPAKLVRELREHKLHCIGEPPDRVQLELVLLCDADDRHERSHTQRPDRVSC